MSFTGPSLGRARIIGLLEREVGAELGARFAKATLSPM